MSTNESLGTINWWGFTPSLDLLNKDLYQSNDEINILLIGSGDSRHIIKTLSKLYQKDIKPNINFYIYENGIEIYARQILQLIISLIPNTKLGLQDKVEIFLELFGNLLIRNQSMELIKQFSNEMIKLITDPDKCNEQLTFLNLQYLKYKEKDIMEHIFKVWRHPDPKSFDAKLCWDLRIRKHLGSRYDAIPNVFDWDCSMILHDRGAEILNSREYCNWRHKGVAFQLRDANYDVSNRTLSSGRVLLTSKGDKTVRLGYWGDIVCSPYLAFGIRSSNKEFFKKMNKQYVVGSERVSEYNVTKMLYEIEHQEKYVLVTKETTKKEEKTSLTIEEVDEEEEEEEDEEGKKVMEIKENKTEYKEEEKTKLSNEINEITKELINLITKESTKQSNIRIIPLSLDFEIMKRKSQFQHLFNMIYLGTGLIGSFLGSSSDQTNNNSNNNNNDNSKTCELLKNLLSQHNNSCIVVETPQYIVDINKTQLENVNKAIQEKIETHLCLKKCKNKKMESTGHMLFK